MSISKLAAVLTLSLALATTPSTSAAVRLRQSASYTDSATGSGSMCFSSQTLSGSLLVVGLVRQGAADVWITDVATQVNTTTPAWAQVTMWYIENAAPKTCFGWTSSVSSEWQAILLEFTGVKPLAAFNTFARSYDSSNMVGSHRTGGTGLLSETGELAVAFIGNSSATGPYTFSASSSPTAGWSLVQFAGEKRAVAGYRVLTTTQSAELVVNPFDSDFYGGVIATFKVVPDSSGMLMASD